MIDKDPKLLTIVLGYAMSGIAGAVGGCAAAAITAVIDRKTLRLASAISYVIVGMSGGLAMFAFGELIGIENSSVEDLMKWALLSGFVLPCVLAGHNLGMRMMLRRFGWDVQLTIRRDAEKKRRSDDGGE